MHATLLGDGTSRVATHFAKKKKYALWGKSAYLGPNQRTLIFFFFSALTKGQTLTHLEKKISKCVTSVQLH